MKFKNPFSSFARDAFLDLFKKHRIVSVPGQTITYTLAPTSPAQIFNDSFRSEDTEDKIRKLVSDNPLVDLVSLQESLGISIIQIQQFVPQIVQGKHDAVLISEGGTGTYIPDAARPMHIYMPGKTRFGKSTLLRTMAIQDMEHGAGVCIMDAKGDLVKRIIHDIPRNRITDTIFLDTNTPVPIDFMSYKLDDNDEKEALIGELKFLLLKSVETQHAPLMTSNIIDLIYTLFNYNENPATPANERATFLDLYYFLENKKRQKQIRDGLTDHSLAERWQNSFPTPNDVSRITSRMTPFVRSSTLRRIFGAANPALNIEEAVTSRKILLVNLGPMDEIKRIYAVLLISKIRQAIYRRSNLGESERLPFYLYCDEFQEFQTSDFDKMLSMAGGLGLCLTLAHQFVDQLEDRILQSILGNVSTFILFRLGQKSASCLKGEISKDHLELLTTLDRGEVVYRAADGTTKIVRTSPPPDQPSASSAENIRKRTVEKYACEGEKKPGMVDLEDDDEISPSGRPEAIPPHKA